MRVEISNEIFDDISLFRDLYTLILNCTLKGRHKVLINYPDVLDLPNFSKLDDLDKDILKLEYVSVNRTIFAEPDINVSPISGEKTFNCEEALVYLSQPVSIILEHSLNDRYFIESLFRNFGDSDFFDNCISKNWITFENAGGSGGFKSIIQGKIRSMKSWPKKDKKKYLRCYVLLDSDKTSDISELKTDKVKILEYLNHHNIKNRILSKREMENYIPEETLLALNDSYLTEYCKLTTIQKDFFDLEKGLITDRNVKKANKNVQEFYGSISDKSWNILKSGIDSEKYNRNNFKTEFPQLFAEQSVNRKSLLHRCGGTLYDNELLTIVNEIKSLL